jgi:hypothetical protein
MPPLPPPRVRLRGTSLPRRLLDWLCDGRDDYTAFQQRRRTGAYRARRSFCLYTWLGAAGVFLLCGSPGCLIVVGLLATLACFTVLDAD